jgi:hypothetical protein
MSTQTISLDLLKRSFPDFDLDTLPQIPSDWEDTSYVNDVCPSFCVGADIQIMIDYQNYEDRELEIDDRFSVRLHAYSADYDEKSWASFSTWSETLIFVRYWHRCFERSYDIYLNENGTYISKKDYIELVRSGKVRVAYPSLSEIVFNKVDHSTPLNGIDDGMRYVKFLIDTDQMFHLEDNPFDIIDIEGKRLFDDKTAAMVRDRQDELYDMDWSLVGEECPIGWYYILEPSEDSPFFGTIKKSED